MHLKKYYFLTVFLVFFVYVNTLAEASERRLKLISIDEETGDSVTSIL